ncbi:MAG: M23 family metallopeptidase, partial [Oscillospiraceae bacterium]|nr:M23 family metallopeptidase [Oscillospiraceae bacterium]
RAVKPEIPVVPSPGQGGDDVPVAAMTAVPAPDASADEGSVPAATPASVSAPPSPSPAPKANIYVWPLKGDTVNAFSDTDLVYNKTMGDWRVHLGMDIAADMGAQVYSVADGKVADVYDDVFWGTTVVIDHGGGIGSRYSNMMKNPTVSVGDEVKAGQVIGGVGSTAEAERREVSHLHFAMEKDKKPIDPMQYLPVP